MKVCIIGTGGHGRVICDIVKRNAKMEFIGYIDDKIADQTTNGYKVIGSTDDVDMISKRYDDLRFIIGIGDNQIRQAISNKLHNINFVTVIDQSAVISDSVKIGNGTVVMPNVVINSQAEIGSHVILNTACSIDHDDCIGDFAHISPGAHLAGSVVVGEGTHVGTGVSVIPGVTIGRWCKIGAGSTILRDIRDKVVAYGVPAKVQREL